MDRVFFSKQHRGFRGTYLEITRSSVKITKSICGFQLRKSSFFSKEEMDDVLSTCIARHKYKHSSSFECWNGNQISICAALRQVSLDLKISQLLEYIMARHAFPCVPLVRSIHLIKHSHHLKSQPTSSLTEYTRLQGPSFNGQMDLSRVRFELPPSAIFMDVPSSSVYRT